MRPTRRSLWIVSGTTAVAVLPSIGLPGAWPLVPICWVLILVFHAADALISPRRRALRWEADLPDTLHIGSPDRARVRVSLPARKPLPLRAALDLSEGLEPQPVVLGRASRKPAELAWSLVPSRRGTVRVETAWIRYASPLGLWSWQVRVALDREIPVLPNLPLVKSTALRFFSDRELRAGLKIERYRGDGTEFESLKEFLSGDDHRTIDWKASARHRKLLCRQFRAERNHQVVLAIDTGHLMCEPLDGIPKLDHALNAALLLAYVCLTSGDRVGLYSFDAAVGPGLDPVGGVAAMRSLIHATSEFKYSRNETNFTLGLSTLAHRLRRRSLIILLTDFVDTVTAELMMENLERIGRRHLVVFVSIRDPMLGRVAAASPRTPRELGRAVIAGTLLRDRDVVHRRLRRMGVRPLDVEPRRIGPGLINQYLDIKRRELV